MRFLHLHLCPSFWKVQSSPCHWLHTEWNYLSSSSLTSWRACLCSACLCFRRGPWSGAAACLSCSWGWTSWSFYEWFPAFPPPCTAASQKCTKCHRRAPSETSLSSPSSPAAPSTSSWSWARGSSQSHHRKASLCSLGPAVLSGSSLHSLLSSSQESLYFQRERWRGSCHQCSRCFRSFRCRCWGPSASKAPHNLLCCSKFLSTTGMLWNPARKTKPS